MEAFLQTLLPRMLPDGPTFEIHAFGGKTDLMAKLDQRLRGYRRWLPRDWRLVVMVDRDNDDCHELKAQLEASATNAGLRTRSQTGTSAWQLVNRVVIEELEAWYFGDWDAVRAAYPESQPRCSSTKWLPRPRRHRRRDLGGVRANPEAARLLHDRSPEDRGGADHWQPTSRWIRIVREASPTSGTRSRKQPPDHSIRHGLRLSQRPAPTANTSPRPRAPPTPPETPSLNR